MWLEISSTGLCTISSADTRRKPSFKKKVVGAGKTNWFSPGIFRDEEVRAVSRVTDIVIRQNFSREPKRRGTWWSRRERRMNTARHVTARMAEGMDPLRGPFGNRRPTSRLSRSAMAERSRRNMSQTCSARARYSPQRGSRCIDKDRCSALLATDLGKRRRPTCVST
jgi:hypothetical protein